MGKKFVESLPSISGALNSYMQELAASLRWLSQPQRCAELAHSGGWCFTF